MRSDKTLIATGRNLTFRWGRGDTILDIAELSLQAGQRTLILGPSGCGKTTLLNLLSAINIPNSGSLELLGKKTQEMNGAERDVFRADHVGYVFQMFNLISYLSILENVLLPIRFSKKRNQRLQAAGSGPRDEALRLLSQLGIDQRHFLKRSVNQLSVGQQQRVAAARALIGSPEIIICDEPTSALDDKAQEAFLGLLFKEVEESGGSLIFVSHDRALISRFDRIIMLPEINRALSYERAAI